jgi:ABC-2 type transport system ATP-binding protein
VKTIDSSDGTADPLNEEDTVTPESPTDVIADAQAIEQSDDIEQPGAEAPEAKTPAKPRPASPKSPRARTAAASRPTQAGERTPSAPRAPRKPAAPRAKAAPSADDAPIVLDPAAEAAAAAVPVKAPKPVRQTAAQKRAAAAAAAQAEAEAAERAAQRAKQPVVLSISNLVKKFGSTTAVDGIDLEVRQGSFYGIVGPNGAGKTTTLSMVTGLLRPDAGTITVNGLDVWADPAEAKKIIGVLPDRLRLFDRLTGRQLLYYSGTLRGLDNTSVRERTDDLAVAFGLEDALGRLVTDYSAGMTKKIALAAAMIHSPRILVLDEPFESVDPVSAANVTEILQKYVATGGTVVLSSHSMEMIQRVCDGVAIIVQGEVLAQGTVDEVRRDGTLEDRFVELAGGRKAAEGMEWLLNSSN